jgi:hypothetical protein
VYSTVRPNPYYGRVSTYTTDARSRYEAVTLNLQHRFSKDLVFFVGATWSEDKDSDSNERNFAGAQAEDLHNLEGSYSWSNRDQRWRIAANGTWNTPWWGIGLSGSYRFTTGSPYTATTGSDTNRDGFFNDLPTIGCAKTATTIDCQQRRALQPQPVPAVGFLSTRFPPGEDVYGRPGGAHRDRRVLQLHEYGQPFRDQLQLGHSGYADLDFRNPQRRDDASPHDPVRGAGGLLEKRFECHEGGGKAFRPFLFREA